MKFQEEYSYYLLQLLKNEEKEKFRADLFKLHPTDQQHFFMTLDQEKRKRVYVYLLPAEFVDIFQEFGIQQQKQILSELEEEYAKQVLKNMYADDLTALIGSMSTKEASHYLLILDSKEADEVRRLLSYGSQMAGGIMTTEHMTVSAVDTVDEVLERLHREGNQAETIYYLYVTDHELNLVGVLSLRQLITSDPTKRVEDLMKKQVISVSAFDDQQQVAQVIKQYDLLVVPVTIHGKLVGIITVDDIMDVVEDEMTEDIGEISAAKGAVDLEINAVDAAKRRLPWLILLLFLGLFTAGIIGRFEATLEQVAILAIFIPLIADMAGNTGTQSLAVVVRGLALGKLDRKSVGRLLKREAGVGLIIGVACAIVVSFISQIIVPGNWLLGLIVGFSLFCTLVIATLSGTMVPLLIYKLKIDPAVASGPFITTINDIIGLLIYFSVASALIQYI
ncbi:magnesium transporter [Caldalkalibacillus mannanilyticus]|uniref:magnesium transporter n=1 Tax=Caldalkalibacillus mannanilyticus TaxID=1418 RepID=UPI000A523A83|nr:magnesium transporter [Caldalkalibacillus mannanilyticus]